MLKYTKIKSKKQYDTYCQTHENLFYEDDVKYRDEIDLLEVLIEEYESRSNISNTTTENLNPVELLKYIMEEDELSQSDIAHKVGRSKQLISDILNYRRRISKELIFKFSEIFAMKPEAFAAPYDLIPSKSKRETISSGRQ